MTAWKNLSKKDKKKYGSREEYRNQRMAGEIFESDTGENNVVESHEIKKKDYSGKNATSFVNKKGDLEQITDQNNPFTKDINKFDTSATGSGALKDVKRYGATDMRGHLAAGKSKEEILNYAAGLGDDVRMGSAAQNLLAKFKEDIKNGNQPSTPEGGSDPIIVSPDIDSDIDINTGVKDNDLDRGSVIVNGDGYAIGGNNREKNVYKNDFNGTVDMNNFNGTFINNGNFNSQAGYNGLPDMSGGTSSELPMPTYGEGSRFSVAGLIPKPFSTADRYRDRADAAPLVFGTAGDLAFNKLMGHKGG